MNGKLLEAFTKGEVNKVLQFTKNLPDLTRSQLSSIIKLWQTSKQTMTPLTTVISVGHYQLTKLLVEDGAPLTTNILRQYQPLSLALRQESHEIAELLIKSGADVNKLEFDGSYPIHWAISKMNPISTIELIISAGFPVNSITLLDLQLRPIHMTVSAKYIEATKTLIKHSADLNVLNTYGDTAVHMAVRINLPEMVKLLVNHGANLNYRDATSCPLFTAIRCKHLDMVELLLELGASIEEGWEKHLTISPLQFAISYLLDVDIINLIMAKGADVNGRNSDNYDTPLHAATKYAASKYTENEIHSVSIIHKRQCTVAKALLDKGADVKAKNKKGRTPLDCALLTENPELCKLLLIEGAEIFGTSTIKEKGTHRFAYIMGNVNLGSTELIRLCLERGADYNYENMFGLSLYHFAVENASHAIVKIFWQFGSPYDKTKPVGPLYQRNLPYLWPKHHLADVYSLRLQSDFINGIQCNDFELVESSLECGAEPKGCSMKIPSTLHYASMIRNHRIARLLLEKGVPVNRVNDKGVTALYIAATKSHLETCLVLLQFGACYNPKGTIGGMKMKEVVKQHQTLKELFKKIYKAFRLVKDGNVKLLEELRQLKTSSKDEGILSALMNCVDSNGLTVLGKALHLNHVKMAEELMAFRIEM